MRGDRKQAPAPSGGFLRALACDVRGNTLAIMAAALIPLAGMVGGGIDISRMYITKTRLQHACDAGALAGRKQMGAGVWGSDDNGVAEKFFDANYRSGSYGSAPSTRAFTENAGKVTGSASATLPMTLMRVLGKTTETLSVTCDAEMKLPNTDVMFVLDTTGSMNCVAGDTSCSNNGGVPAVGSKIDGLKTAVKCFYEILAQLDTTATCATGTPSGGTSSAVQIRFGFMPYASNVNVGGLLPTSYFADSWKYQSREPQFVTNTTYTYPAYSDTGSSTNNSPGTWSAYQDDSINSISTSGPPSCTNPAQSQSSSTSSTDSAVTQSGTTKSYTTTTTTTTTYKRYRTTNESAYYNSRRYYYCQVQVSTRTDTQTTTVTHSSTGVPTTTTSFDKWHYGQITVDVSKVKTGNMTANIGTNGGATPISWDGCIEERPTVRQTSYDPIPSDAYDLNIDLVPTSSNASSLWGPALKGLIYLRSVQSYWSEASTADAYTTANYYQGAPYACPTQAHKLDRWPSAAPFESYVDSLVASGNTYHDIGMLWGARFMSPTGIFASDNAAAFNGGSIARHMIFMTDGDSTSNPCDYNAYGVPFYDQRQTTDVGPANNCASNRPALIDQINARLAALCTAVKNKGITLWVVSYGGGINTATESRLQTCASPPDSLASTHYFSAADPAALQTSFGQIANAISQLRLTK